MMDIEEIQNFCNTLPGVTEDIKWEDRLCFSVANKMFLIISLGKSPLNSSFKVSSDDFDILTNRNEFKPAPYLARYNWVLVNDISTINKKDFEKFILNSYNLVKNKLPKKIREAIS